MLSCRWINVLVARTIFLFLFAAAACAQLTPSQKRANQDSFETVWRTVRDRHPDPKLNGLDWNAIHDATAPKIAQAASMDEVRSILREMIYKLDSSHYAIIPAERYETKTPSAAPPTVGSTVAPGPAQTPATATTPAQQPPPAATVEAASDASDPAGKAIRFANLPELRLHFEAKTLPGGIGYIRFNEFLDPVSIMPKVEAAVRDFAKAPGVIIDLRGNPGGIGIMAMGIAGFFISEEGRQLGKMTLRETTLNFVVFPRPQTYDGPLAVLVDGGSASTAEIFAQGMQDLGRARVFGTRTAAAALPSDIIRLPNGDGFQYAQAGYTSFKGRVLEGNGVVPDEVVENRVIEAAQAWITGLTRK